MNRASSSHPLLTQLLSEVSRSFYLTLRILPGAIRPQIGLAYLLARTADTVADTELVPVDRRLRALESFRERILGETRSALDLGELAKAAGNDHAAGPGLPSERVLLQRAEEACGLLTSLEAGDQARIREVLDIIVGGQMLDLRRFGNASEERIVALGTDEELDDYTYRVAGCVGEFWTRMCRTHVFPHAALDVERLLARGIRFGKGLQLVNILRDLPADLRLGRCYLPAQRLAELGLSPAALLDPANEGKVRPLYNSWLDRAQDHLHEGWEYACSLPWRCARVRLACAWPALIGARTLGYLRAGSILDPGRRIKVSRPEVKRILWQTLWRMPAPFLWRRLFPSRMH